MKILHTIFILCMFVLNTSCKSELSENVPVILVNGEWSLPPDSEVWDVMIFRTDGKYLVFNDMDFVGTGSDIFYNKINTINTDFNSFNNPDIITDRMSVTALVEKGKWYYNKQQRIIYLTNRIFLKDKSIFNRYHGKGDTLFFKVGSISETELKVCYLHVDGPCEGEIWTKNRIIPKINDNVYYSELHFQSFGIGDTVIKLPLSSLETDLFLSYYLKGTPTQIVLENFKSEELYSSEMLITDKVLERYMPIRGVTKLVIRVNTRDGKGKWEINLEVK